MTTLAFVVLSVPAFSSEDTQNSTLPESQLLLGSSSIRLITNPESTVSTSSPSLIQVSSDSGLEFDLGGSDTRKIELLLDAPIVPDAIGLGFGSQALSLPGRNVLGLDATLDLPVTSGLSLTGNIHQRQENVQFQPLGSIQCTGGTLSPTSYTASGCRFVDDSYAGLDQGALNLGARYDTSSTSTAISWFTRESGMTTSGGSRFNITQPSALPGTDLLTPVSTNPLLPSSPLPQPLGYYNGEATGVDLSFQLGLTSDNYGDVRLGLAYSRIFDASFDGMYTNLSPIAWNTSDDFDTARMDLEWRRGSFSGGIQGYYRDQVDFLSRQSLDSMSTFDVHFTWRTPWNADLSVGASNILDAGSDDGVPIDTTPNDPFESIYGRIPYVRYKQDL